MNHQSFLKGAHRITWAVVLLSGLLQACGGGSQQVTHTASTPQGQVTYQGNGSVEVRSNPSTGATTVKF